MFQFSVTKRNLLFPFIVLILLWLADTLLDATFLWAGFRGEPAIESMAALVHFCIFVGELVCLVFVGKALMRVKTLNESLQAARSEAEEAKSRIEGIMEAMVDPVSVQDTDFSILFQNLAHRQMMGEHVGRKCYEAYMGKTQVCDGCHVSLTFLDGVAHRREVSPPGKPVRHLEIISSPIKDAAGNTVSAIEAIRDVTTRKAQEDEIRRLNHDLEKQTQKLKRTCQELEAFSYTASHDLRIPLTRIYSASQILCDSFGDRFDDSGAFLLRTISDACERMEELIEALLTLSQVSSTDMNAEGVDLADLSREIIHDLRQLYPGRSVEYDCPPDLPVTGDRKLLKVLLENLLGNAWKYTGKVTAPRIELTVTEPAGRPVYCIRDNGAGFPQQDAERMFKPFNRLHRAEDFPGTGVGLATVQRIVQRHGGSVWAEGVTGQGAAFFFTLS